MTDILAFAILIILGLSTARIIARSEETTQERNERRRVQRAIYEKYGRTY
jgi:hypothetical protein